MIEPLARVDDTAAFYTDYFLQAKPVVVTGGARRLPAYTKWTDEYLREVFAQKPVNVKLASGAMARIGFADYWAYLNEPSRFSSTSGQVYLADYNLRPTFGDPALETLYPDVGFPLDRGSAHFVEWVSLFAGPEGSGTALHKDPFSTCTWMAMLRGNKIWRMCAPQAINWELSQRTDAFAEADKSPVAWFEAQLSAGDLLYLPPDWWHQVRNPTSSLAVSSNFCTADAARKHLDHAINTPTLEHRELWLKTWGAVVSEQVG